MSPIVAPITTGNKFLNPEKALSSYFQNKNIIMARPIKETPVLKGKDAKRFRKAMQNLQPVSQERLEEIKKSYEFLKQRSNFYLP
jgi:hypothetical protein